MSRADVERFDVASDTMREHRVRLWREANRPLLEVATPGLVVVLERLEKSSPRLVRRLRRDLHRAYSEAVRQGILRH